MGKSEGLTFFEQLSTRGGVVLDGRRDGFEGWIALESGDRCSAFMMDIMECWGVVVDC